MTIMKLELIEGEELVYKNPYDNNLVALGPNFNELVQDPAGKGWILQPDQTVSFPQIKLGIPVYIIVKDIVP